MAKRRKAMAERELDPLDRGCDDRNSRHDVERSEKLPYNRDRNVYRVDTGCQEIFWEQKDLSITCLIAKMSLPPDRR